MECGEISGFQKEDSNVSPICVLCVRHELGKMGISLQAPLPVYCHFKLAHLVCIGWSALGACPAQGEHGCSKTSPFLKGGMHPLSECFFICTFTLWVYKHVTWGKYKSLRSARCSAPLKSSQGCDSGTAREVPVLGEEGSNHLGLHCKQMLCLIPCREPSLRGLFADWVFSIASEIISQGCKACTGGDHTGARFELESCKLLWC